MPVVTVKGAPVGAPATPTPVQDAVERLLLRAKLTPAEWEALRPLCRLAMRTTIFGARYRYVAVVFPDGSYYNVVEGPNDAPGLRGTGRGALAWWSRVLEVTTAEE